MNMQTFDTLEELDTWFRDMNFAGFARSPMLFGAYGREFQVAESVDTEDVYCTLDKYNLSERYRTTLYPEEGYHSYAWRYPEPAVLELDSQSCSLRFGNGELISVMLECAWSLSIGDEGGDEELSVGGYSFTNLYMFLAGVLSCFDKRIVDVLVEFADRFRGTDGEVDAVMDINRRLLPIFKQMAEERDAAFLAENDIKE